MEYVAVTLYWAITFSLIGVFVRIGQRVADKLLAYCVYTYKLYKRLKKRAKEE